MRGPGGRARPPLPKSGQECSRHPRCGPGDGDARPIPAAPGGRLREAPDDLLSELRQAIDACDDDIAASLAARAALVRRVALWKAGTGHALRDLGREAAVRQRYAASLVPAGWDADVLRAWMDLLLRASVVMQSTARVAFQGGAGSWSDESLEATLPGVARLACATVEDAVAAVGQGRAAGAWLAARNSTTGEVAATAGARSKMDSWLQAPYLVRHALLAAPGTALADVGSVVAHPLALRQCAATLARLVPQAALVPAVDGAYAAAALPVGGAVLASARLAPTLGLKVLYPQACDDPGNTTWFHLLVPR